MIAEPLALSLQCGLSTANPQFFVSHTHREADERPSSSYSLVVGVDVGGLCRHWSIWSSLSLGLLASGVGELGELSQGSVFISIAEESLLLDDLGSVVWVTADVLDRDSRVSLRALLDLGDSVSGLVLQSHGESSFEILVSFGLPHRDSDGVGSLGGAVPTSIGEDASGPGLAHELGLVAVKALGQAPDYFR